MSNSRNNTAHKPAQPMVWIKDETGNTYMCPINAIKDRNNVTDEELANCVNESYNPQNN